jgi:CheY-like chemotaxis protein
MTRVLLVDDDPIVRRMYQEALSHQGLQVATAGDGVAAIGSLRTDRPDVVVLDLMMPRLTGVDVLKFIRSEANLKTLPVVVLSNSYMNQLAEEAAAVGVQKALLKVRCSPVVLRGAIDEALSGKPIGQDTSELLAAPVHSPPASPLPADLGAYTPASLAPPPARAVPTAAEFVAQARRSFLQGGPATCAALRSLYQAVVNAPNEGERDLRLQAFYRKVHFVAATAGLAQCHRLAQMASVFEAMLFDLSGKPASLTPSVLRTAAATVDFLALLFDCARNTDRDEPLSARALVVDDDAINNRLVVAALRLAHLEARSTNDPLTGLDLLKQEQFDLVLLDVGMPGMDGFEFCRQLRKLPGCQKTAVIFVTSHGDFQSRVESVLSGGNDLISKPVFPLELSVKAISHLLKRQVTS